MKFKRLLVFAMTAAVGVALITGCGDNNMPELVEDKAVQDTGNEGEAQTLDQQCTDTTPEIDGYNLLWSDEFNGPSLDSSIWTREKRNPGWTNNELQEYTDSDDNIFIRDGKLVLKAIKTDDNGKDYYTSGKVNSQNKKDFMYGKVVVRAKVPEGKGLWPAIWMMPQKESLYGQWPKCGEIDIMEVLCNNTKTSYSTIHYGEPHAEQQGVINLEEGTFSSDFHDYSVEWEPGEMRFYTDDELVLTVNNWFSADGSDEKEYPAPFNQPFFVQMNLAVGGDWPGNPDATTDFDNAEFLIDYVRVYQKDAYDTNVTKPEETFREALSDGNFIYNGDFSDGMQNWAYYSLENGKGSAKTEDGMIIIETEDDGDEVYSIQLVQPELPVLNGHSYRLSFEAKADSARDMVVCVSAPTAGWIRYFSDTTVELTDEWQTFTYEYTSTAKDDNNGRLEYNMGNHGYTDNIYIKNVRIEEIVAK